MSDASAVPVLPEGLVVIVKRECATCELVAPLLADIATAEVPLTVYTQDDPTFPGTVPATHDADLAISWHHDIETVPTMIVVRDGAEVERTVGWHRDTWRRLTGVGDLGADLPDMRPGCGSMSVDPDLEHVLRARFDSDGLAARRVEFAAAEDPFEAMFARGWTDGLPVVPPTAERVHRMLAGTTRAADEIVCIAPPDLVELTVEKIAINAVMAGCQPEYLPWVIAALEAVCTDEFNMHGVLATTMPVGPVIVCNGPGTRAIAMNSGVNMLGQGNRANSTIGRAVQLTIRNVGGGRPGEHRPASGHRSPRGSTGRAHGGRGAADRGARRPRCQGPGERRPPLAAPRVAAAPVRGPLVLLLPRRGVWPRWVHSGGSCWGRDDCSERGARRGESGF